MKIHISASCFEINVYYLIKFCLGPGRSWGFGSPGFPLPLLSVSPMSLVTLVLVSKCQHVLSACKVIWGWVTQQDKCVIICQKRKCQTLKMCICEKRGKSFILKVSSSERMKTQLRCRNPKKIGQCRASDCRRKCFPHIYPWSWLINIKTLRQL